VVDSCSRIFPGSPVAQVTLRSWPCQVRGESLSEGCWKRKVRGQVEALAITKPRLAKQGPGLRRIKAWPGLGIGNPAGWADQLPQRRLQAVLTRSADQAAIDA